MRDEIQGAVTLHATGCKATRDAVEQKGCDSIGRRFLQKVSRFFLPTPRPTDKDLTGFVLNLPDDVVAQLLSCLKTSEQQLLFLLLHGCGLRDAARELGISPPAAAKHCRKIARLSRTLLQKSGKDSDRDAIHNALRRTEGAPAG